MDAPPPPTTPKSFFVSCISLWKRPTAQSFGKARPSEHANDSKEILSQCGLLAVAPWPAPHWNVCKSSCGINCAACCHAPKDYIQSLVWFINFYLLIIIRICLPRLNVWFLSWILKDKFPSVSCDLYLRLLVWFFFLHEAFSTVTTVAPQRLTVLKNSVTTF